jgi:hypothetical protein
MYAYCAAQEVEHLTAREADSGLVRVVVDTPKRPNSFLPTGYGSSTMPGAVEMESNTQ